jgi:hypothetical protein
MKHWSNLIKIWANLKKNYSKLWESKGRRRPWLFLDHSLSALSLWHYSSKNWIQFYDPKLLHLHTKIAQCLLCTRLVTYVCFRGTKQLIKIVGQSGDMNAAQHLRIYHTFANKANWSFLPEFRTTASGNNKPHKKYKLGFAKRSM